MSQVDPNRTMACLAYADEQISIALRQAEAGTPVDGINALRVPEKIALNLDQFLGSGPAAMRASAIMFSKWSKLSAPRIRRSPKTKLGVLVTPRARASR